jgi:phosphoglycolate phosphatase
MSAIRGLLFDKDGTLLDFNATWPPIYDRVALELAAGDMELARRLLEHGGRDPLSGRYRAGSLLAQGNTDDIADQWGPMLPAWQRHELIERMDRLFAEEGVVASAPVLDLAAFFTRLKARGLKLGIATSDNERATRAILDRFQTLHLLDFIAGYDSGHGAKPTPGMVRGFCDAVGLPASAVAMIGDNRHDMEMGHRAGCGAMIGVLTGTSAAEDLAPLATVVLDSIAALEAWLDREAAA